jgi:hypothetical protein
MAIERCLVVTRRFGYGFTDQNSTITNDLTAAAAPVQTHII